MYLHKPEGPVLGNLLKILVVTPVLGYGLWLAYRYGLDADAPQLFGIAVTIAIPAIFIYLALRNMMEDAPDHRGRAMWIALSLIVIWCCAPGFEPVAKLSLAKAAREDSLLV